MMQDVCLFAHFDRGDRLDDYVLRYLATLKELNFTIILISTSRLSPADIARARPLCADIILRDNTGLDFASWSTGFAKHGPAIKGRLLLANDSVYGPIGDLGNALRRLTRTAADFYGMVESIEIAPHLQSWFLLFEPWVVQNPTFTSILAQPFSKMTKRQIIERAEVGFSCGLVEAGFRYHALYLVSQEGWIARHYPMNPTHFLWRELVLDNGVPFLKVELLRTNPMDLEAPEVILNFLEPIDETLCRLIESHRARLVDTNSAIKPRVNALRRWLRRQRNAMVRNGHRLSREKRPVLDVWNFGKFALFIAAYRTYRTFRSLFCPRNG
jgi:lipopolysaccharide biosynthesis protein